MKMRFAVELIVLSAVGLSGPGHAGQVCNPVDFLKPETTQRISDHSTLFAILSSASSSTDQDKKAALTNSVYSVYGISNLDANAQNNMSNRISKSLNLNLTETQKDWLLISRLDPDGVKAYKACLVANQQPWSIDFNNFDLNNKTVFVNVSFNPAILATIPWMLKISNAKLHSTVGFTAAGDDTYNGTISSTQTTSIELDKILLCK